MRGEFLRLAVSRGGRLAIAFSLMAAAPGFAATITVDTMDDEAIGTTVGTCTLREAVQAANTDAAVANCGAGSGTDDIVFDMGYTITLTQGSMSVNTAININATMPQVVTIDGNMADRAFVLGNSMSQLSIGSLTSITTIQNCVIGAGAGGAIFVDDPSATLTGTNVIFDSNEAQAASSNGGAISSSGNVTLTDVIFINNQAGNDGGAINIGGSLLTITNGFFGDPTLIFGMGNTAGGNGGAINFTTSSNTDFVTISGTAFVGNSADGVGAEMGGGAIWADVPIDSTYIFLIAGAQFLNNTTMGAGGAIHAINGSRIAYLAAATPFTSGIVATNFFMNQAMGPAGVTGSGGAIYNRGEMTVVGSSFIDNSSMLSAGGAISHDPNVARRLTVANVTFSGNNADTDGGAIAAFNNNAEVDLINVTISGNSADANMETGGGGVFNGNAAAAEFTVENSIIADNTSLGAANTGNCAGTAVTNTGNNLQFNPDMGCGTMTLGDPDLNAPSIFAGPNFLVFTMEANAMSPALGGGNQTTCDAGPILNFDATGTPAVRPNGDPNCDIGAHESMNLVPVELQSFSVD